MTAPHNRLVGDELDAAMRRFPIFDLSYESTFHKKAGPEYTIGLIIPRARKYFVWFSFYCDTPVCYLLQANKKVIYRINVDFHPELATGTILYGSIPSLESGADDDRHGLSPSDNLFFVAEDIAYYQGVPLRKLNFGAKLGFIHTLLSSYIYPPPLESFPYVVIALPVMFIISGENAESIARESAGYPIYCAQYRSLTEDAPYMNLPAPRICAETFLRSEGAVKLNTVRKMVGVVDIRMPQYKLATVFMVFARPQYDIYSLCAVGAARALVDVDVAYIPNCRTSALMNGLFRRIAENADIDCAEESDDEAEFQDVRVDKYVDLNKSVAMECEFHPKFKKWVPIRPVENAPVVAATRLCR
jgi:hypothetical protein